MSGGWTKADVDRVNLKQAIVKAKSSKYRNVKVTIDGQRFDSKAEADYWVLLKARERAGEIFELQRQVPWELECPCYQPAVLEKRDELFGHAQVSTYIADFQWRENGRLVVADRKGGRNTPMFSLKRKWMALQWGVEILEVR